MRSPLLRLALLCVGCRAFVPTRLSFPPRTLARGVSARQRVEAKAALAEAKDFLGWVLVPPPPPLDSTTVEGSELFRMVGVPPDASYEELTAQVDRLKQKYEGNIKKIKRIEVARDRIVELRLRQRAQGTIGIDPNAALQNALDSDAKPSIADTLQKIAGKWLRKLPAVTIMDEKKIQRLMPEQQEAQKKHKSAAKIYFAMITGAGVILPGLAEKARLVGFLLTMYHMCTRGRDMSNAGEGTKADRALTYRQFFDFLTVWFYMQISVVIGMLGINNIPFAAPIIKRLFDQQVVNLIGHNTALLACDYNLQVYDEKKNQPDDGVEAWTPLEKDDDED